MPLKDMESPHSILDDEPDDDDGWEETCPHDKWPDEDCPTCDAEEDGTDADAADDAPDGADDTDDEPVVDEG